jgi:molybdopterin synthase sulfur carrier subunit
MANVVIPALLRKFTGGVDRVEVRGATVRELVRELGRRFPGLEDQLIEEGEIKPSIAVSIDGEIATGGAMEKVGADSEVHFIPAIGGGM